MEDFGSIKEIKTELEEVEIPVSWMKVDNNKEDPLALTKVKIEEFGGTEELHFPQELKPDLIPKIENEQEPTSTVLYDCSMTSEERFHSKEFDIPSQRIIPELVAVVKEEQASCSYDSEINPELEAHTEKMEDFGSIKEIKTELEEVEIPVAWMKVDNNKEDPLALTKVKIEEFDITSQRIIPELVAVVKEEQPSCSYDNEINPELEAHTEKMEDFGSIKEIKTELEEVEIPVSWMKVDNNKEDLLALTKVKIEEFGGTEELHFPQELKPDLIPKIENELEPTSTVLYDCSMTSEEGIHSKEFDITSQHIIPELVAVVKEEQPSCSYDNEINPELEAHTEEVESHSTEEEHTATTDRLLCTSQDMQIIGKSTRRSTSFRKSTSHVTRKSFNCTQCNYSALLPYKLKLHMRKHTGDKPYKCGQCDLSCSTPGSLKVHMRVHTDEKPFKCSNCDYSTAHSGSLKVHMTVHTGEKPYKCAECDFSAFESRNLKLHMSKHTGEKPYKCAECDYSTTQSGHLKLHMSKHTGEKLYKCASCDYSAAHSGTLKQRSKHTGEKPYKCSNCDYSTAHSGHLKVHMRMHTGEKPYKCANCDYSTSDKGHLRRHMRVHTGEKPYKCGQCDLSCSTAGSLKVHMRMHTGEKPYKCSNCDYSTAHSGHLKVHMRMHTGEKPYKCSNCDYSTAHSGHLKVHMRMHTGEKPYKCSNCDYSTTQSGSLKVHMKVHNGEKPYKCANCDYYTSDKNHLRRHMQVHTGEKPYKCANCDHSTSRLSHLKCHVRVHTGEKPCKL